VLLLAARRHRLAASVVMLACAASWCVLTVYLSLETGAAILLAIPFGFAAVATAEVLGGGHREPRPGAALAGWLTLACFGTVVVTVSVGPSEASWGPLPLGVVGQHFFLHFVLGVPAGARRSPTRRRARTPGAVRT
jgi:hypothetical protein